MDILKEVEKSYDEIASHFSRTRVFPWPEMTELISLLKPGIKVLDIGCGNGRFLEVIPKDIEIDYLGIDLSEEMINEAKKRYPKHKFLKQNVLDLEGKDKYDLIVSFACLHHLPDKQTRFKGFNNIYNLLKKDGVFIFTVWNLWQVSKIKFIIKSFFLMLFGKVKSYKDCFIPWKNQAGKLMANRYYYAFTTSELSRILKKSGFRILELDFRPKEKGIFGRFNIVGKCYK